MISGRVTNWMRISVLSLFMILASVSYAQDGKKLFKGNCGACHKIDKKAVGPALMGVEERWEDRANLISWIKNSQQYLKDNPGDAYAANLFQEFGGSIMPAMPLADAEIEAILSYIKSGGGSGGGEVVSVGGEVTVPAEPANDYTVYWLMAFGLVFLIVIKVLLDVKASVKKVLLDVKGAEEFSKSGEVNDLNWTTKEKLAYWMSQNKIIVGLGMVVIVVGFLNILYWSLMGVGVYEGYAPEQPIKFSHKIHAGDHEINCVYCHSSAEKGKHSGIPSVNVCMNCHKGIQEGKRWGTEEIAKIYEAAGWNVDEQKYDKPEKPVKWIKIHNLPDHVYFNHSQHVVVGQVECQTCHGEVQTFDYPMHQEAPLTMGWCINCHRETEVKMAGNGYYEEVHKELMERYKMEGLEKFTVEHIGGLECAKCHY